MTCRICGQSVRPEKTDDSHHLEQSPTERDVCLGCWIGRLEFELWILRATGRSMWTLKAEELMREVLAKCV